MADFNLPDMIRHYPKLELVGVDQSYPVLSGGHHHVQRDMDWAKDSVRLLNQKSPLERSLEYDPTKKRSLISLSGGMGDGCQ